MDAAVRLPEGFEYDILLIRRNTDAGVAHGERHSSAPGPKYAQAHLASFGELQRIGQQVFQDLAEPL